MARRRKDKRKKLKPGKEEPTPIPTPTPKPEPTPIPESVTRRLVAKQLEIEGGGKGHFRVTADGTVEIAKGRLYLFKKDEAAALAKQEQYLWKPNIEVSLDIRIDELLNEDKQFVNVGGCTNHFTDVSGNSNGRNYSVVFRLDGSGLGFKKETIHGCYDEYSLKKQRMGLGKWYNIIYRQTVIEADKKIKLEGWVNDTPIGEKIDSGAMTKDNCAAPVVGKDDALYSPIKNAKQVWTAGAYSGLYIRLSGTAKSFIKNVTVKEF